MIVLGIETSCDETGVGIVRSDGGTPSCWPTRSRPRSTSTRASAAWCRRSPPGPTCQAMVPAVHRALATAGVTARDVDAVAVTAGPGLSGALLVGVAAAKAYATAWDVPLYGVNHLAAHVAVDTLQHGPLPAVPRAARLRWALQPARRAGHRGPGHPARRDDRRRGGRGVRQGRPAARAAVPRRPAHRPRGPRGRPRRDRVPARPHRPARRGPFDFSFSGLKTAVARHVEALERAGTAVPVADVAASFQEAVVDVLTAKAVRAARERGMDMLLLGGGVAANSRLRALAAGAVRRRRASRCACRGRGCAPTTGRWSPRWARTSSRPGAKPGPPDLPADSSLPVTQVLVG